MWEQYDRQIRLILREMSKTYLFGILRVDLILHFVIGLILTLIIRRWKKSPIFGLALVLLLQLIKEYYDSFTMTATIRESVIDTLVTISYPLIVVLIHHALKKINRD